MVICSLDAFKKSSKKKETRIKKEIVEVLQQPSYRQKQPSRAVLWKGLLRNFTKFTGKHLCQSLFFNKVAADPRQSLILKALFFLNIYKILSRLFGHIGKTAWLER